MKFYIYILFTIMGIGYAQELVIITEENENVELADIAQMDDTIIFDLRYATDNNVTQKKIYNIARCLLAKPAAEALVKVNQKLKEQNLVLKIFDAYRPHSCQKILWAFLPDPRYVADPKNGSRHNRGCAVDLTICSLDTKEELEMPSAFDDFSEKAHRDNTDTPENAKQNSELLRTVMEEQGFLALNSEWWHFDYKDWKKYPLLDIPLEKIKLDENK